jgi:GAF domain-containing protein
MTLDLLSTYFAIAPGSNEAAVLRLLVSLGMRVADADEGSLLVLDETAGDLVFAMTVGDAASEQKLLGQRVPLGTGLTGLAAATREVQIGAPTYKGIEQAAQHAKTDGPTAVIAAPMLVGDDLIGVITAVSFREGRRFTSRDGDLYAEVASIAGVLVQQRRQLQAAAATATTRTGKLEREIVESVGRLAGARTEALERVACLLRDIEGLVT